VGGSLLVIGSPAGIIAMSEIKELTFLSYMRYLPMLLLAYTIGYGLTLVLASYFVKYVVARLCPKLQLTFIFCMYISALTSYFLTFKAAWRVFCLTIHRC